MGGINLEEVEFELDFDYGDDEDVSVVDPRVTRSLHGAAILPLQAELPAGDDLYAFDFAKRAWVTVPGASPTEPIVINDPDSVFSELTLLVNASNRIADSSFVPTEVFLLDKGGYYLPDGYGEVIQAEDIYEVAIRIQQIIVELGQNALMTVFFLHSYDELDDGYKLIAHKYYFDRWSDGYSVALRRVEIHLKGEYVVTVAERKNLLTELFKR